MFDSQKEPKDQIAIQPHGVAFPWPSGVELTALEPLSLVLPAAVLGPGEKIGSVIHAPVDLELSLPRNSSEQHIVLKLTAGMTVSLSKSVQAMVVSEDRQPKRIKVALPQQKTA